MGSRARIISKIHSRDHRERPIDRYGSIAQRPNERPSENSSSDSIQTSNSS